MQKNNNKIVARTSFRWVVAALFFTIYAVAGADRANLGVALPYIRAEFPMTNAEAGALLSMFLVTYACAQLPAGFIMSRFGVRKLFSLSMVLTSLFTGVMGLVNSVLMLKLLRLGLGVAEGPIAVGIASTINNWFPAKEKGTATGIFLAAIKFGSVLVPPICVGIIALWGWRAIFYFFAVPGLLLSVMWFFMVPDNPAKSRFVNQKELDFVREEGAQPIESPRHSRRSFVRMDRWIRIRPVTLIDSRRQLFKSWDIIGCALGFGCQVGITNFLMAWIPTYLVTVKQYSMLNMGFVAAAPWVGAVIGNLLGGILSDRFLGKRRKPGMILSAVATTVMMLALINSPADPLWLGFLLFSAGVLLSIGYSSYMVYPMGLVAKKHFPIASGLVNTGGQLGGAATPFIVGLLLDHFGWGQVFTFMACLSVISFLILVTMVEPMPGKREGDVSPAGPAANTAPVNAI
ncbi:MFS transporter [Pseudomonas tolaasii]|uniref:MFS transporter n=1 Tax=Pseudomonas tolaasii TaxID=29442 RepID=UPI0015A208DF|nr:MFS transporter [Pseudomonas tolaasii]NVZ46301.1 MFS transporter [Pseudomonas tolaasii]NWA51249.1 MFS transporter [Pseudomonas tolaasii]